MKIYEVGGCVRDRIMGLIPNDLDYVVVGSNPAEMLSLGYKQVGNDFPVFLHPHTGDEYALARRERKTGAGYGGFDFDVHGVTIEEDGREIQTLDKDLLREFLDAGFKLDQEYDIETLMKFFRQKDR